MKDESGTSESRQEAMRKDEGGRMNQTARLKVEQEAMRKDEPDTSKSRARPKSTILP
jgi:hypothetical protein